MSFMPIQDTPVIRILEQAATQLTPTGPFSDWPSLSVSLVGSPCPGSLFSSKGIRKTIHPRTVRSGREFPTAPLGCRTKYGPCAPDVHCPPFSLWSLWPRSNTIQPLFGSVASSLLPNLSQLQPRTPRRSNGAVRPTRHCSIPALAHNAATSRPGLYLLLPATSMP